MSRKDPAETKTEVPEVVGIMMFTVCRYDASCILMIWVDLYSWRRGRDILGGEVGGMLEFLFWKFICRIYSCIGCVVLLGHATMETQQLQMPMCRAAALRSLPFIGN